LDVNAGAGTRQYQWQKNGLDVINATNATLTFASSKLEDTGVYAARVSNANGSTTSDEATVSVLNNVSWSDNFSTDPMLGWHTNQYLSLAGFSWQGARRTFAI